MVRESRKMCPVLLAQQSVGMFALFRIVQLDGFIIACRNQQFTCVVEVEGGKRDIFDLLAPALAEHQSAQFRIELKKTGIVPCLV